MDDGNNIAPRPTVSALLDDFLPAGPPSSELHEKPAKHVVERSWSRRLLGLVQSAMWLTHASDYDAEVEMARATINEYRLHLMEMLIEREASYEAALAGHRRLSAKWAARLRPLAPEGLPRACVEKIRFLSVLMIHDKVLQVDMEACVVDLLRSRHQATEDLAQALASTPTQHLLEAIMDAKWTSPVTSLIKSNVPHSMLRHRQAHLEAAMRHAYSVILAMPTNDEELGCVDAPKPKEVATVLRALQAVTTTAVSSGGRYPVSHLNAFRRCVSDTRTRCGRLLRDWAAKLLADAEATFAIESGNNASELDHVFVPGLSSLIPATTARIYVTGIRVTHLPPPKTLLAFERYFALRVQDEFQFPTGEGDAWSAFRMCVHHTVFSAIAKIAAAYEVQTTPGFSRQLYHFGHATSSVDLTTLGAPATVIAAGSLPATEAALARIVVEVTPGGVVTAVLAAMHCMHNEVGQLGCHSLNADVLIPLLIFVIARANVPALLRRLALASTFSFDDGSEAAYYLTCMRAAVSVVLGDATHCATCADAFDSLVVAEVSTPPEVAAASPPLVDMTALSAWIADRRVAEETLLLVEAWMA
ncbi:hypothetical protein SDRG_15544 [Saprolegnia diclina VS20]|uniref:VPS9 domain-containing protein n=1 Tax=Saprolegnia diclina (strain VS20) TaxID=1156394 RepID=T0PMH9_SAPDV|nr:hypothetical protein SDRG_15544 [Saprolegnia diclina VS20]EQC26604.1 hypothetical protein SDRG_15544 [Saprolegnia diclina VS20]|eukprot:XP_008619942.1 hypothetical protein SDRG_15544 [Saprolegnia diclina VS20]